MDEKEKRNLEECKLDESEVLQVTGGVADEPELDEDDIKVVGGGFKPMIFIKH